MQEAYDNCVVLDGGVARLGDVNTFVDAWSKYDRNAAMWLPISRFVTMMQEAPWPLGMQRHDGSPMSKRDVVVRLRQLNVPVYSVPLWRLRRPAHAEGTHKRPPQQQCSWWPRHQHEGGDAEDAGGGVHKSDSGSSCVGTVASPTVIDLRPRKKRWFLARGKEVAPEPSPSLSEVDSRSGTPVSMMGSPILLLQRKYNAGQGSALGAIQGRVYDADADADAGADAGAVFEEGGIVWQPKPAL